MPNAPQASRRGSHPTHEIVAWDTGLGITRSSQQVIVHVVSRVRTRAMKEKFYVLLALNLAERCGLDPADLIASITETATRTGLSVTAGHSS